MESPGLRMEPHRIAARDRKDRKAFLRGHSLPFGFPFAWKTIPNPSTAEIGTTQRESGTGFQPVLGSSFSTISPGEQKYEANCQARCDVHHRCA